MDVVRIDASNRDQAYRVLATAFADDPVIRWLVTDPRRDAELFKFLDVTTHGADEGSDLLVGDDGRFVGAAYWDPPGHRPTPDSWRTLVHALKVFRGRVRRGMLIEEIFKEYRPDYPHWYLASVGVTERGRGFGTALIRHGLERVDGPAYLESSKPENVPLYERFGFEVITEVRLPLGGPPMWPMLRPA